MSAPRSALQAGQVTIIGDIRKKDVRAARTLAAATGVFTREEIAASGHLVEAALTDEADDPTRCHCLIAEIDGAMGGFACFGRIPLTQQCWDFYWMAVHPDAQGRGLASMLSQAVCAAVAKHGGLWLYAEVSSLPPSEPVRRCHTRNGFDLLATIPDFYKPGDAKLIFRKNVMA